MDKNQQKKEADLIAQSEKKLKGHIVRKFVPREELIESHPKKVFNPPGFVKKTGSVQQYEDLCNLYERLYQYDEENVGLPAREVEVCLALTGEYLELTNDLRNWFQNYLESRLRVHNPRDNNDSFKKFRRLEREFRNLLPKKGQLKNSINYIFLDGVTVYAMWLIYQRALHHDLRKVYSGGTHKLLYKHPDPRSSYLANTYLAQYGWENHSLKKFLDGVDTVCDPDQLSEIINTKTSVLYEDLKGMVTDILQMRPFLLSNFKPEKTAIPIGSEKFIVWNWALNGVALIKLGESEYLFAATQNNLKEATVRVDIDGVLFDYDLTWKTVKDFEDVHNLALNYYVIHKFWERFFSFYEQIDLDRIRNRISQRKIDDQVNDDEFALSCRDIAKEEQNIEDITFGKDRISGKLDLRPLRLKSLLKFLKKNFDCEIRQGKGSEIITYRKGGKIFRFGSHKRNPIVPFERVSSSLKRLGISRHEWCKKVYS